MKTSASLKLPDDAKPELNPADPMWSQAKAFAHKQGLSQAAFEEGIDIIAGRDTVSRQQVQRAVNAEIQKLGPAGAARMDAIAAFYEGHLGRDGAALMTSRIFNSHDVGD